MTTNYLRSYPTTNRSNRFKPIKTHPMRTLRLRLPMALLGAGLLLFSVSCKLGPNEEDPTPVEPKTSVADAHENLVMDLHKITVAETIPGGKYLYLKVQEGDDEYWAATGKSDIAAGETYYYNEALIQKDFESKELGRTFETIYLITQLVPEAHGASMQANKEVETPPAKAMEATPNKKFHSSPLAGKATSLSIAQLLDDPAAYEGKVVELTGTCTKINEGILGRNWLHLKDGTADSQDLVMTSSDAVDPGTEITIRAIVNLNRDFGAGYSYDVLLEEGKIIR